MGNAYLAGLPAAVALLLNPAVVRAQSCDDYRSLRASIDQHGRELANENPGITLLAVGCLATAADQYDKTHEDSDAAGTFAVCGGLGCTLATGGYGNCISVGSEIIVTALHLRLVESRMRELGCAI